MHTNFKLSSGLAAGALAALATAAPTFAADRVQTTELISRSLDGGVPNGPSTNAVISGDRRSERLVAFESDASDLVSGDGNGRKDVFAVQRGGSGDGPWRAGKTLLISRGRGGQDANGASWAAAVDGGFKDPATCVAFLSSASNLVKRDTNGKVDAFVSRMGKVTRVSLPGRRQATEDTTEVAVNGNCKQIAFVTGGTLYVRSGKKTRSLGRGNDPSWSVGKPDESDLVYTGEGGVRLSKRAKKTGTLVGPGGRNPAYNNVKRKVITYEVTRGGRTQVVWNDLGQGALAASSFRGTVGDGNSRNPVIGNSGYYIAFESSSSNLQTNPSGSRADTNGNPDVYLYTGVRKITLMQSVQNFGAPIPGGARNPSMSFYANYITWDAAAPLTSSNGAHQIFMRYLGGA